MAMPCTELCWTAVKCPACERTLPPRGRSAPWEMHTSECPECEKTINPRHLWNEHDSDRAYFDAEGWDNHLDECVRCGQDYGDE